MNIKAGLVGLPNVGKSTLFNALTKSSVPSENYPFCTIDPHLAITEIPDERIGKLAKIFNSAKKLPATVSFVDIAGLVKGASSGEGLGNKFLSHIREVNLILHVLRIFEGSNIIHGSDIIDPIEDYEIIITELMLKDLESVKKRIQKIEQLLKANKGKPAELKDLETEKNLLIQVSNAINDGNSSKIKELIKMSDVKTISLLSEKNFLIIANISEDEIEDDNYKNNRHYKALIKKFGTEKIIPISAKIEYELSQLTEQDTQEMMKILELKEKSLEMIIRATYKNLGLITFFTCGPKETHAWPIKKGMTIRQAAGEIHTDLQKGFICAEIYNCTDIFEHGSETKLKELGKIRTEGQDYIVKDCDIVHIKFNI